MATAQVLPKELRLSAPPTMPQARSYLFKQGSVGSVYEPGQSNVVTINLPRLQRSYLTKDSYLKFRIALGWTNNATFAAATTPVAPVFDTMGAFGLFDRIEVYDYLGSTLLESTSGFGQLMGLLIDTQSSSDELAFHYNANSGMKGGRIAQDSDVYQPGTATGSADATVAVMNLIGANTGHAFTVPDTATPTNGNKVNASTTYYYEFCIPLFSFLGLLSPKFAPLHNGYTINFTLNTAARAFGFSGTGGATLNGSLTTYKMDNIYMCCQVLELGPVAESMLLSSTQGQPLVVPSKAYRNYVGNVNKGSSSYRLDLNLNVASLTNILWIMRPLDCSAAALGVAGDTVTWKDNVMYKSLSYRIRNYLQNWNFQYGSTILPQTSGIQCMGMNGSMVDSNRGGYNEGYCELMKARHALNASNFQTNINKKNFWIDTPLSGAANEFLAINNAAAVKLAQQKVMALTPSNLYSTGKFACGLDLELVSGRSNEMVCGMNTNGMNTSINATFHSDFIANVENALIDAWCEYDSFINISPGIATTVSF